jgi:hypothetical protein
MNISRVNSDPHGYLAVRTIRKMVDDLVLLAPDEAGIEVLCDYIHLIDRVECLAHSAPPALPRLLLLLLLLLPAIQLAVQLLWVRRLLPPPPSTAHPPRRLLPLLLLGYRLPDLTSDLPGGYTLLVSLLLPLIFSLEVLTHELVEGGHRVVLGWLLSGRLPSLPFLFFFLSLAEDVQKVHYIKLAFSDSSWEDRGSPLLLVK